MELELKGPGIYLSENILLSNNVSGIDEFTADLAGAGFQGLEVPVWNSAFFDIQKASGSAGYCEEVGGKLKEKGMSITGLFMMQGQCIALHPVQRDLFAGLYPARLYGKDLLEWAQSQLILGIQAAAGLNCSGISTFSGSLACPYWDSRFHRVWHTADEIKELTARWIPVLDLAADMGIEVNFHLHQGCDIATGVDFDRFIDYSNEHRAIGIILNPATCILQGRDPYSFISMYADRIRGCRLEDGERIALRYTAEQNAVCIDFEPRNYFNLEFLQNRGPAVLSGNSSAVKNPYILHPESNSYGSEKEIILACRKRDLGDGQVDIERILKLLHKSRTRGWVVCGPDPTTGYDLDVLRRKASRVQKGFNDIPRNSSLYGGSSQAESGIQHFSLWTA